MVQIIEIPRLRLKKAIQKRLIKIGHMLAKWVIQLPLGSDGWCVTLHLPLVANGNPVWASAMGLKTIDHDDHKLCIQLTARALS